MPTVVINGINTYYQVLGSGSPLLMYSPGGFNAALEAWRTQGAYAELRFLTHLATQHTCIAFDRRECGASGGRVEAITWADYADQGKGLLDHLGISRAHVMGGCMGVSCVTAFAARYPHVVESMVLYWPVGGPRYRFSVQERFAKHLAYVAENGLEAVVNLVLRSGDSFSVDPRGGPWATVIRTDPAFRFSYARQDIAAYKLIVVEMLRSLFERDTAPGPNPEELMRLSVPALIIPGQDYFHGTSAARYLSECLEKSEYWDVPVDLQTESITSDRILQFLKAHGRDGRERHGGLLQLNNQ